MENESNQWTSELNHFYFFFFNTIGTLTIIKVLFEHDLRSSLLRVIMYHSLTSLQKPQKCFPASHHKAKNDQSKTHIWTNDPWSFRV